VVLAIINYKCKLRHLHERKTFDWFVNGHHVLAINS
jgi:hypothetical protein